MKRLPTLYLSECSKMSPTRGPWRQIVKRLRWSYIKRTLVSSFWFCNYSWREDLAGDIVSGLTMVVMQILQGVGYALLADAPPVFGLYTSIIPVLVYAFLGSASQVSKGTNAMMCVTVGTLVLARVDEIIENAGAQAMSAFNQVPSMNNTIYIMGRFMDKMELRSLVVVSLSFIVGICQVVLGLLQLGRFSWICTEIVTSAFILGTACHILASQTPLLLGIKIPQHRGIFSLVYAFVNIFKNLDKINPVTFGMGLSSLIVLIVYEEIIRDKWQNKCSIPFPIQLLVVILGTGISYGFQFDQRYNVDIIGEIPKGIPVLAVPPVGEFFNFNFLVDSLIVALIGYILSLSTCKQLGQKLSYNRELMADGIANVLGSLFQCIPMTSSISRSTVQVSSGSKTQLASIISALIITASLFSISFLFTPIPKTILAAIILSCIKGMLLRAMDIKRFFRRSKLDGTLWLGTLLAILLATPDKGLITCFVLMIVSLAYRSSHCRVVVGNKSCTALLAASSESATRPTCLLHQVVRVEGLVNFSNYEGICKNLEKVIAKWMRGYKQRLRSKRLLEQLDPTCQQILSAFLLVIDLSKVPYLDQIAAAEIAKFVNSVNQDGCSDCAISILTEDGKVKAMLESCELKQVSKTIFGSLTDALEHHEANARMKLEEASPEDSNTRATETPNPCPGGQTSKDTSCLVSDSSDSDSDYTCGLCPVTSS